ncbi:conserved oligomeric Golgi complex subunit 1 isoform X2 [Cephus cinctus]|uniref:Conserved oligomeric Golgi complex subunit 1 n=1 Tax=Cephus cinctus TaxID=211228 RepID=A0AAJ7CG26_CEPCN|nr:conserved oligomeric Golgi complex subunit 1 isoform X2 [Cephus cinctus]
MPALNLLDLDINKLFEEHTIKEIEEIQKKIQYESDRKKVELRTLVGERYRDLIQAADTIADMKRTSEDVITRIIDMEDTCRTLQQKYLIGFKMDSVESTSERESWEISDSVVMQIKILMDIPEQIWSAIDARDFLLATQLYMLAQHVNYSLTFEIGNNELTNKYPIIAKQWGAISQFKNVILNGCIDLLQSLDLSAESAANSLASLVLLDGASSSALIEKLISMRSKAIETIIKDESHHSVRNRIKLCVKLLTQTIILIRTCFIKANNKEGGLVMQYINSVTDLDAAFMFAQLDLDKDLVNKYLPTITKNHKPFTRGEIEDFSITTLHENLKTWLSWVKTFTTVEVSKLLNLVTSVRGIFNIREEALALEFPDNWNTTWEELSLPVTNFWAQFFQPLLTERAKGIMNTKWTEALANLKTSIKDLLGRIIHEKYDFPEHDLRWFVWKDSPNDIPQKLSKNGAPDSKRSLLMKTKGYSPNVVRLCDDFDKDLFNLLLDLEQYLYETDRTSIKDDLLSMNISLVSNKFADRSVLQEELQRISTAKIEELTSFVRQECLLDKPKFGRRDTNAIFIGRFLQALCTLCPNLNKCFTFSKVAGLSITNVKWQSICDILKEQSIVAWSSWADSYKIKICEHRDNLLKKEPVDGLRVHSIISEWEKVTIEEEAEEGKRMKSEIFVPYQPSVPLQKYLAAVSKDLNSVIPHTIPKKVLTDIVDAMVTGLFDYYGEMSKNSDLRQKQAFQVFFDLKYISLLMVPRENKILIENSVEVSDHVLSKIDPFDLDVFYPFIQTNVKRSVQRTLLIFGSLVPHSEQLHSILGARMEYSSEGGKSVTEPAGVLAVCTGAPWFPSLAVTAPARNLPLAPVTIPDKNQIRDCNWYIRLI